MDIIDTSILIKSDGFNSEKTKTKNLKFRLKKKRNLKVDIQVVDEKLRKNFTNLCYYT